MTERLKNRPNLEAEPLSTAAQTPDPESPTNEPAGLSRREVIKRATGALLAAPLVGLPEAQAAAGIGGQRARAKSRRKPLFFNNAEFALVDELTELIIPTDEHSRGARAAKVAAYIDQRLAESFTEEPRQLWRNGLKQLEGLSKELHGRTILQSTKEQRIALLTRIAQNESNPKTPEERFFKELKSRTAQAYYSSKIGIHEELQYKGNTYQKDYAGYDAT
jgi:hypothetical protein